MPLLADAGHGRSVVGPDRAPSGPVLLLSPSPTSRHKPFENCRWGFRSSPRWLSLPNHTLSAPNASSLAGPKPKELLS
ncbi:hypothetical protein Nepgr_027266 [Nepenthes gracilis]|uniref:Uncharacterized protein n=1 Tax=Nepenthes gracilis TaxID=150966 RepID=A0AAD3Y1B4_NEPGR|nr:hypothetical protein Nepgr_027266 [Nepenthes gracilis]